MISFTAILLIRSVLRARRLKARLEQDTLPPPGRDADEPG